MAKPKTYEEAAEQLEAAKGKLSEAKEEVRNFKKEHKIKRGKPIEDAKVNSQLEKLEAAVDKAREAVDTAKEAARELKPRKERVTKYEYPEDCVTDKDKKRYRAKMRRDSKKDEKGETDKKPAAKKTAKKAVKKPAAETED